VREEAFVKRVFGRILLCVSALAGAIGCGESLQPNSSGSGNATVMAYMPQEKGGYALEKFELIGISDIKEVAGRFVNFFVSPKIIKLHGKEKMDGSAPRAQFIRNSAGHYIASNSLTIEMFTIYAHMQKLAALDEELGAQGVNKWPRDIGIAVRAEGGMTNNAQYYGPADVMYFVRYTKSDLPIQVNAGVLAHEHFHSLFYKLVPAPEVSRTSVHKLAETASNESGIELRKLSINPDDDSRDATIDEEMREVYFGGLNEGFADFWGWMYTGDPDFVGRSLPEFKMARTLKRNGDPLLSTESLYDSLVRTKSAIKQKSELSPEQQVDFYNEVRLGLKYEVGTRYSRMLKDLSDQVKEERGVTEQESRKVIAKALIQVLPLITKNEIGPMLIVQSLAAKIPELKEKECGILREAIQAVDFMKRWSCDKSNDQWLLQRSK
jgi:hypothetical protein